MLSIDTYDDALPLPQGGWWEGRETPKKLFNLIELQKP